MRIWITGEKIAGIFQATKSWQTCQHWFCCSCMIAFKNPLSWPFTTASVFAVSMSTQCCAPVSVLYSCQLKYWKRSQHTALQSMQKCQWDIVTSNVILSHCSNTCFWCLSICFHRSQRELFHWFQGSNRKKKKKKGGGKGMRLSVGFLLTGVWHFHLQFWLDFP